MNLIYDNGEYKELIPENEQDGVVVCEGKISGKSVIVAAQDFTYKGGSLGLRHGRNIAYAIDTALKKKCKDDADKMDAAFVDIDLLKKVVTEHSERLQELA